MHTQHVLHFARTNFCVIEACTGHYTAQLWLQCSIIQAYCWSDGCSEASCGDERNDCTSMALQTAGGIRMANQLSDACSDLLQCYISRQAPAGVMLQTPCRNSGQVEDMPIGVAAMPCGLGRKDQPTFAFRGWQHVPAGVAAQLQPVWLPLSLLPWSPSDRQQLQGSTSPLYIALPPFKRHLPL